MNFEGEVDALMDEVERDMLAHQRIAGARERARRQGTGGQGDRDDWRIISAARAR